MFQVEVRKAGFVEGADGQRVEFQAVLLAHTAGAAEQLRKIFEGNTHTLAKCYVNDEGNEVIELDILSLRNAVVLEGADSEEVLQEVSSSQLRKPLSVTPIDKAPTPLSDPMQENLLPAVAAAPEQLPADDQLAGQVEQEVVTDEAVDAASESNLASE